MEQEINIETERKKTRKKRTTKDLIKLQYYTPLRQRMSATEIKINSMLNKVEEELKKVEVEWYHLKGMITTVENPQSTPNKNENIANKKEINLDNATEINELQCDFRLDSTTVKRKSNRYSESESEADILSDSDIEDLDTEHIFI